MVSINYVPKQGDIVEMDFNPTKGHEQRGKRPALVISNNKYYYRTKLLIVCPISNTENDFPLHLQLDERTKTTGSILTQHIRTIDPVARTILFKETVPNDILEQVIEMVNLFF